MDLHDDLTEEELASLAEEGTDDEMQAVARHPNASLQTLNYLARRGFAKDVDQNPLLPLYIEMGSDEVVWILENVAEQTQRGERLEELATSIWNDVRSGVARNTKTPTTTLSLLAKDPERVVRRGVATNVNTPQATLSLLAKDQDEYLRRGVATNANTPQATLSLLAKDQDMDVRRRVASNSTNTSPETLSILAKDKEDVVRKTARATLAYLKKADR